MIFNRHSRTLFTQLLMGGLLLSGLSKEARGEKENVVHEDLLKLLEPLSEKEVSNAKKQQQQSVSAVPSQTEVEIGTKVPRDLPAEEILSELRKILADHYKLEDDLQLSFVKSFRGIRLPDQDYQIKVTEFPEGGIRSSMVVRCRITSGGELVGEWPLALRAQLWREAWVAKDRLERGQTPDPSQLTARKVDVLKEGEGILSTSVNLNNFEMAEGVNPGRLLARRDVTERPLVRKNQIVEVSLSQGALSITMKAIALENGTANSLIRLRNIDSRKEFSGRVIDESHVQALY